MAAAVPAPAAVVDGYATLKEAAFCKCKEAMDALVRVSDAKCGGGLPAQFNDLRNGVPTRPVNSTGNGVSGAAVSGAAVSAAISNLDSTINSSAAAKPDTALFPVGRSNASAAATVTSGSSFGNARAANIERASLQAAASSAIPAATSLGPSKKQQASNAARSSSSQVTPAMSMVSTQLNGIHEENSSMPAATAAAATAATPSDTTISQQAIAKEYTGRASPAPTRIGQSWAATASTKQENAKIIENLRKDIAEYNIKVGSNELTGMNKEIQRNALKRRVDILLKNLTDGKERDMVVPLSTSMAGGRRRTRHNKNKTKRTTRRS